MRDAGVLGEERKGLKNLLKYPWTSLFALALLVVSLAVFAQTFFFTRYESSYDRFHSQHKSIFRVEGELVLANGETYQQATTPLPLAPVLVQEFSEITQAVRFTRPYPKTILAAGEELKFCERGGIWADVSFFKIFTFPFAKGSAATALSRPGSIVLTRTLAEKYFPNTDPLGKILRINNLTDYRVTGVVEDVPRRSHFRFDFVVSSDFSGRSAGSWQSSTVFTYVLLSDHVSAPFAEKLRGVLASHGGGSNKYLYLKPLTKIHQGSDVRFEFERNQSKGAIKLYLGLAVLLLVLAAVNLSHLFLESIPDLDQPVQLTRTARFKQAGLLALCSSLLASLLALIFLPVFGRLVQRVWEIGLGQALFLAGVVFLAAVLQCMGAVVCAVLCQRKARASSSVGDTLPNEGESLWFKRITVVFSFFVVSVLLLVALLIYRQFQHLQQQGWGMSDGQIKVMDLSSVSTTRENRTALFRKELLKNPNVMSVANALSLPFMLHGTAAVSMEAVAPQLEVLVDVNFVDAGYVETFGLEYLEGGSNIAVPEGVWICLLNESAARAFLAAREMPDYSELVGKQVRFSPSTYPTVVGVVKNFPISFKKDRIEPLILLYQQGRFSVHPQLAVRLFSKGAPTAEEFIRQRFEAIFPEDVFEIRSFSETARKFYQAEQVHARILLYIAMAALCLAFLGLGAMELSGPFWQNQNKVSLILAGNLAAWPLVYLPVQAWLGRFAQQADIPLWLFLASGLGLLALSVLIVNVRTIPYWLRGAKWVIYYLCVWFVIEPRLIYSGFGTMQAMPAFRPEDSWLHAALAKPGGLAEALSGFLSQFFYVPWVAALIVTAAAWGLSWCLGQLLFLASGRRSRFLRYLPAILLFMLYHEYEHVLGVVLVLAAALMSALGWERLARVRPPLRLAFLILMFLGLFFLAGSASLVFAAVALLFAGFQHRDHFQTAGGVAISLVLSFALHGLLFDAGAVPYFGELRLQLTSSVSQEAAFLRLVFFLSAPLVLAAWFLVRSGFNSKPTLPRARLWSAGGLLLLLVLGIALSSNPEQKLLHRMIFLSRHERWTQILEEARKMPRDVYNMYINYQINRALYFTGRLGDEMFSYVQDMASQAMIALEDERYVMQDVAIADVTMDVGALNISEHITHELMEVSGISPFLTERLFWINFGKRQYENGRIFLNAFSKDILYGKRGRELQRRLATDPQLRGSGRVRYLNNVVMETDFANVDIETLLLTLLEENRYNRMAFEYLMAYYLMTRQLEKVVENLPRLDDFGYRQIPVHYEEAIYLYALNTGEEVELGWRNMRPETTARFETFARLMTDADQPGKQEALRALAIEYPGSYFFYYSFDRSGKIE